MALRILYPRNEDDIPDPYLLLGSAKQHIADHNPQTWGDQLAWVVLDTLQGEVE